MDLTDTQVRAMGLDPNNTTSPQRGSDGNIYTLANNGRGGRIVSASSDGSGSTNSYPTFNFDWEKARKDALDQLTPYYEQKLREAGGDVERAKRLIEEDYATGIRYSKEDLETSNTQAEQDAATAMKSLGIDIAEEDRNAQGGLNQRGTLLGTIAKGSTSAAAPTSSYAREWTLNPLYERQGLRKLAIERALERQKESGATKAAREQEGLTTTRNRGIEEQDIQYPRIQRDIEEERRRRAFNEVTPMKYQEEYAKYRAINNLG